MPQIVQSATARILRASQCWHDGARILLTLRCSSSSRTPNLVILLSPTDAYHGDSRYALGQFWKILLLDCRYALDQLWKIMLLDCSDVLLWADWITYCRRVYRYNPPNWMSCRHPKPFLYHTLDCYIILLYTLQSYITHAYVCIDNILLVFW